MIAWFATKGTGSNESLRLQALLSAYPEAEELPFDRANKRASFGQLLSSISRRRPRLLMMEGTGIAGGAACLAARLLWGVPYVVSSGDAVGPFISAHSLPAGPLFALYERILFRFAAGFIGWTPYLCGRAMSFGCRRAVTAAGWPIGAPEGEPAEWRARYRQKWGISEDTLVVGIVGSIEWNERRRYCYGLELVSAVKRLHRNDMVAVIVGGGSGLDRLRAMAAGNSSNRICLPGPVPLEEVLPCLSAFDVAILPQSTDAVGAFRYTTKLSEYAAARLPVISSRIPMAYDLGDGWVWRLPGEGPWQEAYIDALSSLLERLNGNEIAARRAAIPAEMSPFVRSKQVARVTAFVADILEEEARSAE